MAPARGPARLRSIYLARLKLGRSWLRAFGELEERVMRVLWEREGEAITGREVHAALTEETPLAYTTVMTVLDRLWRKGVVRRERGGRAYRYAPVRSEAEHTAALMRELLARTGDPQAALAHFVRGMRKRDEAVLLRLLGEARRRGRK